MTAGEANVFAIHQLRSFYAPTLGAVVTIGLPSNFDKPVFQARLRAHASYVDCGGFPDLSAVNALEEMQRDLFLLAPEGIEDSFAALTLRVPTLERLNPSSPQGQLSFASGHTLPIVDLIADLVALLPDLELWSDYAEGGVLRDLRVPPPVYAKAVSKHGLAPFLSECTPQEGTILPTATVPIGRTSSARNPSTADPVERPWRNSLAAGLVFGTIALLIVALFGWPTNRFSFGGFALICLLSLGYLGHSVGHFLGQNNGKL